MRKTLAKPDVQGCCVTVTVTEQAQPKKSTKLPEELADKMEMQRQSTDKKPR